MIQWMGDSPIVVEASPDMFCSEEEVSVCNVMFVMRFLRVCFNDIF